MNETPMDGSIVTFKATHPKWSFAKVNQEGLVTEVAEKNPISDTATVGFYYWKKGSDFKFDKRSSIGEKPDGVLAAPTKKSYIEYTNT